MNISSEQRSALSSYYLKTAWLGETPSCNLSPAARAVLDPSLYRYSLQGRVALALRGYTIAHPRLSALSDYVTSKLVSKPLYITPPSPFRINREYRVFQNASQVACKLNRERAAAKWEGETYVKPLSSFAKVVAIAPIPPKTTSSHTTLFHESHPIQIDVASTQGKPNYMEDEYLAQSFQIRVPNQALRHYEGIGHQLLRTLWREKQDVTVFGVFDGHSGREACTTIKAQLTARLTYYLETWALARRELDDVAIFNALKLACVDLSHRVSGVDGSCAAFGVVVNGNLWIANTGDSRAVLDNGGKMEQLSRDAKAEKPDFFSRISKRGGRVFYNIGHSYRIVGFNEGGQAIGALAPAGTIGDYRVTSRNQTLSVSARPKIIKIPLNEIKPNSRVMIASDGLWDVATSKEVVDAKTNALQLVSGAYGAGSKDNITAMIVDLSLSHRA